MASLGTRTFWKPTGQTDETSAQVKKDDGYIDVVLTAARYNSKGNFWQRFFGGTDQISLSTKVAYRYGTESVQADTIQDVRKVKANRGHFLGLNRQIVSKLPTDADSLELAVALTGVKDDGLERALVLLNSDEFQKPLELAPPIVGQLAGIGSVVKRLLTSSGPHPQLESSYPGVLSTASSSSPLVESRLMTGHLIMISNHDDDDRILDNLDSRKLMVVGDGVLYDSKQLQNTYLVYTVSLDRNRGPNTHANWYTRYQESVTRLDDIYTTQGDEESIFQRSITLWTEANALLAADRTYLAREAIDIRRAWLNRLKERRDEIRADLRRDTMDDSLPVESIVPEVIALDPDLQGVDFGELATAAREYSAALGEAGIAFSFE